MHPAVSRDDLCLGDLSRPQRPQTTPQRDEITGSEPIRRDSVSSRLTGREHGMAQPSGQRCRAPDHADRMDGQTPAPVTRPQQPAHRRLRALSSAAAPVLYRRRPRGRARTGKVCPRGSRLTLLTGDHRVWSSRASAGANTPRTRHSMGADPSTEAGPSTGSDPSMGADPSTGSDPSMEADPSKGADELDGRRAGDAAQWVGAAYP